MFRPASRPPFLARRHRWQRRSTFGHAAEIRNLDDDVKNRLRMRAAGKGRSMEEEARLILREAVGRQSVPEKGLGTAIHEMFRPFGGVDLELPPRGQMREPPKFD